MTDDFSDFGILIDEFVAESVEWLDTAVDAILSLEKTSDQEAIDRIFRVVHTIKGTANMFNLQGVADFVHSFEDICSDIRSGERKVDKKVADGLLKCMDFIRSQLEFIGNSHHEDGDLSRGEELLRELKNSPARAKPTLKPARVAAPFFEIARAKPAASANPRARPRGVFLRLEENAGCPPPYADKMAAPLPPARRDGACKALIVEDDFVTRNLLYSFLSRFMSCYMAKDGSEAIQAVTESFLGPCPEPFSLILMDIMMPIIDGFQATQAIRAMERAKGASIRHAEAKIFITTAVDDHEAINKAIHEYGADSYMIKPLDFETMTRLLVRHRLLPHSPTQGHSQQRHFS